MTAARTRHPPRIPANRRLRRGAFGDKRVTGRKTAREQGQHPAECLGRGSLRKARRPCPPRRAQYPLGATSSADGELNLDLNESSFN